MITYPLFHTIPYIYMKKNIRLLLLLLLLLLLSWFVKIILINDYYFSFTSQIVIKYTKIIENLIKYLNYSYNR